VHSSLLTFLRRPIVDLKLRPFPNRHPAFQFIDNPLARFKRLCAISARHAEKKRWLRHAHKADPMTHHD
jgi:hypothetical protein